MSLQSMITHLSLEINYGKEVESECTTCPTTESKFYLKVTSKGIIEDCNGLQFAPYNLDYSGREDDFSKSGLSPDINNWNDIDDFNWLHSGKQSPNWSLLPDEKRQSFSM